VEGRSRAHQAISTTASTSTAKPSGSLIDAHRRAGMASGVAQHLDHQVRAAVDDLGDVDEVGTGLDEAAQLDHPHHAVEIAVAGGLHLGQQVDPHRRAAFWAVSRSTSTPTVPLMPPEASSEIWPEMWTRFPERTKGT
jgi:hypothetical protein